MFAVSLAFVVYKVTRDEFFFLVFLEVVNVSLGQPAGLSV